MQFLVDNWYYFAAAFVVSFLLLICNFFKTGKDALSMRTDWMLGGMIRHTILAVFCFLSGLPALVGLILAIIKFAKAN